MNKQSDAYKSLCTEFYDIDKPAPPKDALECYLRFAEEAQGAILEPMCGTGRFLIPLVEKGHQVTGFDSSSNMLNQCRKKCKERGLSPNLIEASFETFSSPSGYNSEIEHLLLQHGLKVIGKWQAEPHTGTQASEKDPVILFECVKI